MVSMGFLIKFTNDRSEVGRVSYCKTRFKKNRANTNEMNFPTINESIVLKENAAVPQRWKGTKESSLMWEGSRDFKWQ